MVGGGGGLTALGAHPGGAGGGLTAIRSAPGWGGLHQSSGALPVYRVWAYYNQERSRAGGLQRSGALPAGVLTAQRPRGGAKAHTHTRTHIIIIIHSFVMHSTPHPHCTPSSSHRVIAHPSLAHRSSCHVFLSPVSSLTHHLLFGCARCRCCRFSISLLCSSRHNLRFSCSQDGTWAKQDKY